MSDFGVGSVGAVLRVSASGLLQQRTAGYVPAVLLSLKAVLLALLWTSVAQQPATHAGCEPAIVEVAIAAQGTGRPVTMEEEFRLLQLAGDHQKHDNKPNQTSANAIVCAGHKAAGGHGGGVPAADAAGHWRGHPRAALRRVRQGGRSCMANLRQGTASMGPALLGNIMHGVACRWCSLSRASATEQMPKRRNGGGGHAAVAAAPAAATATRRR